ALHGLLQGRERALHERLTALIERARADHDRAGTLPPPFEINRQSARVGMESLFLFAAFLQQPHPLSSRPVLDSSLLQRQLEEEAVDIIPAELGDPSTADHLVAAGRHTDDRGIEGPTTEIIDHDQFAAGAGTSTVGMMGIFDARRRRLIEEPTDQKASAAEGL